MVHFINVKLLRGSVIVLPRGLLFRVSGDIKVKGTLASWWVDILTLDLFTSTVSLLRIVETYGI